MKNKIKFDLASVAVFLLFSVYYAFYYIDFNDGVVEGENYLTLLLKVVAILILLFTIYTSIELNWRNVVGFAVFSLVPTIFFISKINMGVNDYFYLNFLIFTPLFLLSLRQVNRFAELLPILISIQVVVDIAIRSLSDKILWTNQAFVGGMGNPSTFGVTCVISIIFLMSNRSISINIKWILCVILSIGAFLSQSMLALLLLLLTSLAFVRIYVMLLFMSLFSVMTFIGTDYFDISSHNINKLFALWKFGVSSNSEAESVYGRIDWLNLHLMRISDGKLSLLWGDWVDYGFMSGDNQLLGILSLGGLTLLIPFILFIILRFKLIVLKKSQFRKEVFLLGVIHILFFSLNRSLEYFPYSFVFFISVRFSESLYESKLCHGNYFIREPQQNSTVCMRQASLAP